MEKKHVSIFQGRQFSILFCRQHFKDVSHSIYKEMLPLIFSLLLITLNFVPIKVCIPWEYNVLKGCIYIYPRPSYHISLVHVLTCHNK